MNEVFCPRCGCSSVTVIKCGNEPLGLVVCSECHNVFTLTKKAVYDELKARGMIAEDQEFIDDD